MKIVQFFRRIKSDILFRRKIYFTCAVFYSYLLQGWSDQQIGVALPYLQNHFEVDLKRISTMIIVWHAGCVLGSLVAGVLFDNYNRLVLMFLFTTGLAVSTIVLPYCSSLALMIVSRFVFGVFTGGSDTGSNTIVPTLWGEECGPYVQLLYASYAVGGILAPFVTLPFMSKVNGNASSIPHFAVTTDNTTTNTSEIKGADLTIQTSFYITGALFLTCAIPYIVMKCMSTFDEIAGSHANIDEHENDATNQKVKGATKRVVVLCLLGAVHAFYVSTEEILVSYLVTFSLEFLRWRELESATLASSFWISSCIMSMFGMLLATLFDPANIMWVSLILTNCSFGLVIVGHYSGQSWLIWTGIISSGFAMSMILPTVFTWAQKYTCNISGKVSSFVMITAGLFSSGNTYFISYMMENQSNIWFLFILLGGIMNCFICYICAYFIRFKCSGPSTKCCNSKHYNVQHQVRVPEVMVVSCSYM